MSLKDWIHRKKQEDPRDQSQRESSPQGFSSEQLHELTMEMTQGYGVLPPCGFPEGIWHLY